MDHKDNNPKSVWDWDMRGFLDRVASKEPTPGGGAVAAVAASQGVALLMMSLEISLRRNEPHPDAADILVRSQNLMELLTELADEDVKVFKKYLEALNLPRNNEEQESRRADALDVAASKALEVPLRSAEKYLEGLALAKDSIRAVVPGVASDVGAGAALLHGALEATLYNVDINARGIKDARERRMAFDSREELQREGDQLDYVIRKEVQARIASS